MALWMRPFNGDATAARRNHRRKRQVRCGCGAAAIFTEDTERADITVFLQLEGDLRPERVSWQPAPASASLPGHLCGECAKWWG